MTTENPDDIYYSQLSQPRAFDGASTRYKTEQRGLLNYPSDEIAVRELLLLQMRSAHALRNDGYAATARKKYVTSLGAIKVIWKNKNKKGNTQMQDLWDEFADNPNHDGIGTLANTQSVWNHSIFSTGNAYSQILVQKTDNTNTIPLKLKAIPSQMHDIAYRGTSPQDNIKFGMKFDPNGVPLSYFFRENLYNSYWYNSFDLNSNTFKPVEIDKSDIIHIFEREEPGQWIGIPKLAPVLIDLYDIEDLTDATIAKQKAAQAISWIIENTNPQNMTGIGVAKSVVDVNESTGKKDQKLVFNSYGGNVQYMNKGEKIHFYQSTDIGSNLAVLIRSELRKIASTCHVPYHSLTGDTDGLDFSSIRAIGIELRNRLEYIHHFMTIPLGLTPLCKTFANYAKFYNKRVTNTIPVFQLPRWYGVDELKDTQADVLEVQMGFATLEAKLQERHTTFEQIVEDAKRNQEQLKPLGIDLYGNKNPSTSQSGNTQANINSTGN